MKKNFYMVMGALAALMTWGSIHAQQGVLLPQNQTPNNTGVNVRRGDANSSNSVGYIKDGTNVNNEFGAGETSTITANKVSWPNSNEDLHTVPATIQLGSVYSQNIVINTYNFGGYATQFLFMNMKNSAANNTTVSWPSNDGPGDYVFPANEKINFPSDPDELPFNASIFHTKYQGRGKTFQYTVEANKTANLSATDLSDLDAFDGLLAVDTETANTPDPGGSSNLQKINIYLGNHTRTGGGNNTLFGWRLYATTGINPYTTTIDGSKTIDAVDISIDDKTPLYQTAGAKMNTTSPTDPSVKKAPSEDSEGFTAYNRPTTIAIQTTADGFIYDNFIIKDVNWWYRTHQLKKVQYSGSSVTETPSSDPTSDNWADYYYMESANAIGMYCAHIKNPEYQYTYTAKSWDIANVMAKNNLLDAAIQILPGSSICVKNDIEDATENPGSETNKENDKKTDAMLVVPGEGNNFALRVGRDFKRMNMHAETTSPGENAKYTQTNFPEKDDSIFLYAGSASFRFKGAGSLLEYKNNGAVDINVNNQLGSMTTKSGLLGVYGSYDPENATIHTSKDGTDNNPGVIEVGPTTTGTKQFNIYSGGVLKNYVGCFAQPCFPITFGSGDVPTFDISGTDPLYILNDGNCCQASIIVSDPANIATGFSGDGTGDLHIQAAGSVKFEADFSGATNTEKNLNILADKGYNQFKGFKYENTSTGSDLVIWAKGSTKGNRSCTTDITDCSGLVWFEDAANITHSGTGLTLIRSEYDDVVMDGTLDYTNSTNAADNGEFIMQAGQDIDAQEKATFTQAGQKSILLEAKQSVHMGGDLTYDRTSADKGDITIKAGYDNFSKDAKVTTWALPNWCTPNDYALRENCTTSNGGDIWFKGNVDLTKFGTENDINTTIRAWNSVYIDKKFDYKQTTESGNLLIFAETGNVEATAATDAMTLDISSDANGSDIKIQAGNQLDNNCAPPSNFADCWIRGGADKAEFDGNILYNKPLDITNKGKGSTLISAARDIENQEEAPFTFTYDNKEAKNFDMTAGRHIETHAKVTFNYGNEEMKANITMQAGRLDTTTMTCADDLCKANEWGTNLSSSSFIDNTFAKGGDGQGSILMFAPATFNYDGKGDILMTALNGNIESDPYLHGSYPGGAATTFTHKGEGTVTMEAIDIKLHDILTYDGESTKSGEFTMHAYDSILTRNLSYTTSADATGNVEITTDKRKATAKCDEHYHDSGDPYGIRQGHIVLGYGSDTKNENKSDTIKFDFSKNTQTTGANLLIRAGYEGFKNNPVVSNGNIPAYKDGSTPDNGKGYGGNITFDYMIISMGTGNGTSGGYAEISTPNGNIWGKDSLTYSGHNGDIKIDAGLGSMDEVAAIRWKEYDYKVDDNLVEINDKNGSSAARGSEDILNTVVPYNCCQDFMWRTGNIMLKGGSLNFNEGTGNAILRTREGYIDVYDKFTAGSMKGDLLVYAGSDNSNIASNNQWGDVSFRDFAYEPMQGSGSVFIGADDNVMLNYGYSNGSELAYMFGNEKGLYDITKDPLVNSGTSPFYNTPYNKEGVKGYSTFNVNENGYLWYKKENPTNETWKPRTQHRLFRGCEAPTGSGQASTCNPESGEGKTIDNGARPLNFDFSKSESGGLAIVAANFIDFFTEFNFKASSNGMGKVPEMGNLRGENVEGYVLYIKSQNNGTTPERRRGSCFGCGTVEPHCTDNDLEGLNKEMTYVAFHDDANIVLNGQKGWIEAPLVEFFGTADIDAWSAVKGAEGEGEMSIRTDSLIFHDSVVFEQGKINLNPYTTDEYLRMNDFRYGIINDNKKLSFYKEQFGPAITMVDRGLPVLELGYQTTYEPGTDAQESPNAKSMAGNEETPWVGGDIIVSARHGYEIPIFNTVVANHARISFTTDSLDGRRGGEYSETYVRTDLLRIRNKVEFYFGQGKGVEDRVNRSGVIKMVSKDQLNSTRGTGMFTHHLHLEPGSELSIPGEDSLYVVQTTTVGGYGNIHENVIVEAGGILAPGFASLMEGDCQSGCGQGSLTIHNLTMEKDAILRVSHYGGKFDVLHCDSIFTFGKVPVRVLLEGDRPGENIIADGCYLIMTYNDTEGLSKEYVNNLLLETTANGSNNLRLDYSEVGKVYLCVGSTVPPTIQRYIDIPMVEGVTTTPGAGKHYVRGHEDFTVKFNFAGAARSVTATGYYTDEKIRLDNLGKVEADGTLVYTFKQVTQPWTITFGEPGTDNEALAGNRVWAHNNTLYVNVDAADVLSIHGISGVLQKRVEINAGLSSFTLERGMYVVTLKNGEVFKIVIK